MKALNPTRRPRRLSLGDRLELRFSTGRSIDGLWVGTIESDAEAILERVEQALAMIRTHDPRRYQRLRRDILRIWVRLLFGDLASFNAAARACQLDSRYVRDGTVTLQDLATSIVHEATHARIDHCVAYREDVRDRIEAACRREELAFSLRLPGGAAVAQEVRAWLAAQPPKEFWSDSAFEKRFVEGRLEALRHLGVPNHLLRVIRGIRSLKIAVHNAVRGLIRRWSGSVGEAQHMSQASATTDRSTPGR